MPKVSVLMPVYRTEPAYLKEAIESVLHQTYPDFELLVLDDCPKDLRESIVKSFKDKRIKYFKNEKNMGISQSRNKLLALAQGEYIAVMDHDDIAMPTRFSEQVKILDENPKIGVVGSWVERFPATKIAKYPEHNQDIERYLMQGCAVAHTAAMVRKSILKNVQYEEQYSPAEDYCLWCRLIGKTEFYNVPKVLMKYRWYEGNTSKAQATKMSKAADAIHSFVRAEHSNIWQEVCENVPNIVRLKLFGAIPCGKFIQHGNKRKGVWKWLPFIRMKTKICDAQAGTKEQSLLAQKILIHCHIFYPELWVELKRCIGNVGAYPFELYVTMVQENLELEKDIRKTFPRAHIEVVENRGYDIGPFVHVLNKVDLNNYSYVIKLHTKRDMPVGAVLHCMDVGGSRWRDYSLSFLKTSGAFENVMQSFAQNKKLGMHGDYHLILPKEYQDEKSAGKAQKMIQKLGFKSENFAFVAGSIFIARAKLFKPLQKLKIKWTDFEEPDAEHKKSTFAHVVERFLGYLVVAQGMQILDVVTPHQYSGVFWNMLRKFSLFLYRRKVNQKGILTIRICRIPIYMKNISNKTPNSQESESCNRWSCVWKKEKCPNGRRHIYIFGIKVFSYRHRKRKKQVEWTLDDILNVQKSYKAIEQKIQQKVAQNQPIKVAFLVTLPAMFPAKPLMEKMCQDKAFQVTILAVPDFRFGPDRAKSNLEQCVTELSAFKDHLYAAPLVEKKDSLNLKDIADILFLPFFYDVSHQKYSLNSIIQQGILPALVSYGMDNSFYSRKYVIASQEYGLLWRIFTDSEFTLKEFQEFSILKGKNVVLSGYCKMDQYRNISHESEPKTLIIAPHHSIKGGFNDVMCLSNFLKYSDLFLKLPDMYPGLRFIFRPHPALLPVLERGTFWGKAKTEKYMNDMATKENVRISLGGNYLEDFAQSDGIIQDCGSFLTEYFYTLKPQLYLLKTPKDIEDKFIPLGQACLHHCYQGYTEQDILDFIEKIIIKEQDVKKETREKFAKESIMVNYGHVSEVIIKYLKVFWGVKK